MSTTNPTTPTTEAPRVEQHRIEVILEAEQPIKHLAESLGNTGLLMTRKVRQPDGTFARVPCVSADTARHQIRETGAKIQLAIQTLDRGGALSEAALRLLFAGGMVTGDGDAGSVKMGEYRHLRDMVPILGLLGGCAMNRTIPGRTQVDDLTLVCAETAHYLPAWVREVEEVATMMGQSWRAAVEEPQRVRMDPSLSPTLRHLLDDGSRAQIEARLDRSEKASAEGDAVGKDAAKSTMMPRRFQRIAQGSLFVWGLTATLLDALDHDTLYSTLGVLLADMRVGGGGAVGHGRVRVLRDAAGRPLINRTVLRSFAEVPEAAAESGLVTLHTRVGEVLTQHLKDRADGARDFFRTVNA